MFINSGNCRLCETGIKTSLRDDKGEILYTGDIVFLYLLDNIGSICAHYGIRTVIANHYLNVFGELPKELPIKKIEPPYIQGIKGCSISDPIPEDSPQVWRVRKVKSFKTVTDGEIVKGFDIRYSVD